MKIIRQRQGQFKLQNCRFDKSTTICECLYKISKDMEVFITEQSCGKLTE